ncbi:hypothetical protein M409DRAFT_71655 [Zasmidium cellare ATCC 36951]|uniref:Elongation of fatty acids protein n=1 Tax=Zasmidium cellare ATCC 36951 TaxID=1080233 RepID=A0A6A6BWK1_ZASCE|nr:uncharacterized protein M409DRAFT_71655 [Zasmidium cellare ATCC 36951]KAF2158418.1 hypothetical protein M409DRAFT_71655 [Zasmidium cellare ATCC 36951]
MSGPQVYLTTPTFGFLPDSRPGPLPPPVKERSFRSPFGIEPTLFHAALRPEIPVTFATIYIVSVFALNAFNRKRNHKPWWIARQPWFQWFVVVHNALLTLYSTATFLAMCRAIAHTWPGLNTETGLAGAADALCKLHGPRGLGDAATFNTTINIWEVKNTVIKLGYDSNPDPSDFGRLWNEGLAFWGWVFYVSKFYEVLDTLIILAKGKRSATLQTYHHAGAMLCMWAGIRYMSPPIWMFVFINSFIHALMYTYFTLSAVGVKVPGRLKRLLTSLQILQFVWGASYAAAHLFIQYDIPVSTPYQIASYVKQAASSASSAASAASSTASKVIESPAAATGTLIPLIKKLLLRAVGEEGIAERVTDNYGDPITSHIEEKIEKFNEKTQQIFETRYRTDWTKVNCIDTSGEAFAIYLNLLYLAPLTFLFGRFFIKAYTGRGRPRRASHAAKQVLDSGHVAHERTEETVEKIGKKAEDEIIAAEAKLQKVDAKDIHEQLRRDVKSIKDGTFGRDRRVSDHVQTFERRVKTAAERAKEQTSKFVNGSGSGSGSGTDSPKRTSKSPSKRLMDQPSRENLQSASKDESVTADEPEKEEGKNDSAAQEATSNPSQASESGGKQEENLADSLATRTSTAAATEEDDDKENQPPAASDSQGGDDEKTYAEAVRGDNDDDGDRDFPSQDAPGKAEPQNEPEESQEANLATSQAIRPNPTNAVEGADDTDAMGKSGVAVDRDDGEEDQDGQETDDQGKPIFRPPGAAAST